MSNAPERITTAKRLGGGRYIMGPKRTMAMGYVAPVEYVRADLVPQWQPIETAPKDGTTIVAWCDHKADKYNDGDALTIYAGHCEVFGCNGSNGLSVVRWGGEWDTCDGYLPNWWFDDDDFESPVNPTHWMPLPPTPKP